MALGVAGLGCEDAMHHLLNFMWPNIFETVPHLVSAFTEACDGMRLALGPGVMLLYILQVLEVFLCFIVYLLCTASLRSVAVAKSCGCRRTVRRVLLFVLLCR